MVARYPFTRWLYQRHARNVNAHGGSFFLVPVHGPNIRAAEAIAYPCGHLYYRAYPDFYYEYNIFLGLTQDLMWARKCDLVVWLEACIHNSFMRFSAGGVSHCWYQKCITDADLRGQMVVPRALRDDISPTQRGVWVLLKHGSKIWPVRMVNNTMQNGWVQFRRAHNISAGFNLIFVCDRKWIFTVIILSMNNTEAWYGWTPETNPYWRNFHLPEINLRTAFLPLIVSIYYPFMTSGYEYLPDMGNQEAFEHCIAALLEVPTIRNTVVHMADRQWELSIANGHINSLLFGSFMLDLQLHYGDYILIALMTAHEIRTVVLDGTTKCERLYNWF